MDGWVFLMVQHDTIEYALLVLWDHLYWIGLDPASLKTTTLHSPQCKFMFMSLLSCIVFGAVTLSAELPLPTPFASVRISSFPSR